MITGASRGFGRALAEAVLSAGDRLVATARRPEQLTDLVSRYGDQVRAVALDVTDTAAARNSVQAAVDTFGRLDVVVNNAGYANSAPIEEMTEDDFRAQWPVRAPHHRGRRPQPAAGGAGRLRPGRGRRRPPLSVRRSGNTYGRHHPATDSGSPSATAHDTGPGRPWLTHPAHGAYPFDADRATEHPRPSCGPDVPDEPMERPGMTHLPRPSRVALVTGATSRIGAETARRLHHDGFAVLLTGRSSERGEALARELGPVRSSFVPADLTQDGEPNRLLQYALDRFGRVDAVVNNAAVDHTGETSRPPRSAAPSRSTPSPRSPPYSSSSGSQVVSPRSGPRRPGRSTPGICCCGKWGRTGKLCDLTLCAPDVVFGDGSFRAGSVPGAGMYLVLRELAGIKRANHVAYTGQGIAADEAYRIGLANEVLPRAELLPPAHELATQAMGTPRTARRRTHEILARTWRRRVVAELRDCHAHQLLALTAGPT